MGSKILEQYQLWLEKATADIDLINELKEMDKGQIEDSFYRNLTFGTGGLRGIIGAGTNRINIYTISKASQGLSNYILKRFPKEKLSIAISYDSRIKSELFAHVSAEVFAANGIRVFIYPQLMPTPCLSFAVRELGCSAGVMVTASHNPAKYNGYKVYGADGCQITTEAAVEILAEIEKLNIFTDIKRSSFSTSLNAGMIQYIKESIYDAFVQKVMAQSLLGDIVIDKNIAIVYSPLNGTGLKPVLRTLKESGYTNITVVKEQEQPDGYFPTCPYPNPEIQEAMALGMEYAKIHHADLLIATDPDCDRCGIAVRDKDNYRLLSGNEVGLLLLDYICSRRIALGTMPKEPVFIKTIVTTDLAERIANHYGVKTINVLTGFKFIGEQIGVLESQGELERYILGFEESYGYLSGTYVRDKDAVNAAFVICEMFSYYKKDDISLLDKLNELYKQYGYCINTLHSYEFEGAVGFAKMQTIMKKFQNGLDHISSKKVVEIQDFSTGLHGLPKSDVLKFILEGNCSVVVRPSGTEPKIKVYLSISAENHSTARMIESNILNDMDRYFV